MSNVISLKKYKPVDSNLMKAFELYVLEHGTKILDIENLDSEWVEVLADEGHEVLILLAAFMKYEHAGDEEEIYFSGELRDYVVYMDEETLADKATELGMQLKEQVLTVALNHLVEEGVVIQEGDTFSLKEGVCLEQLLGI